MRALVTGGAGFIGSHLVDRLMAEGHEVVVLDNLSNGSLENLRQHEGHPRFEFVRGDITDASDVRRALKGVDAVFHLAAIGSVSVSVEKPIMVNQANVDGTLNLLNEGLKGGVRRFIYASSCVVYGEGRRLPIDEEHPTFPVSPYAVTKLAAENYCRVFSSLYGLEAVCLRYFNVYGPRQSRGVYASVMGIFLDRIFGGQPIIVFGDGEQTRDWVYVEDVVEANVLACQGPKAVGEVINVGSGVPTTVNELARSLIELAGRPVKTIYAEARRGEIRNSWSDIGRARALLGYRPRFALRDGLALTIDYWKQRALGASGRLGNRAP